MPEGNARSPPLNHAGYANPVPDWGIQAAGLRILWDLTNLYNQRPTWLDLAHRRLDEAVFDAYGWPVDLSDDDLLARLLELNLSRAAEQ